MRRAMSCLLAALAVASPLQAAEFPLDCATLGSIVAQAPTLFRASRGQRLAQEDAAGLAARLGIPESGLGADYSRSVHASDTPMAGAARCEVVEVRHADAGARYTQVSHACRYPGVSTLPADLNARLARCLSRPPDPDADATSMQIDVDTVESGEGWAGTSVEVQASALEGLQLSVVQSVCENRRTGGCDEDGID